MPRAFNSYWTLTPAPTTYAPTNLVHLCEAAGCGCAMWSPVHYLSETLSWSRPSKLTHLGGGRLRGGSIQAPFGEDGNCR